MFSKAKRFEPVGLIKNQNKTHQVKDHEEPKSTLKMAKSGAVNIKSTKSASSKSNTDVLSQCGSIKSTKSFVTPKSVKITHTKAFSSVKKLPSHPKLKVNEDLHQELIKAQEVEIKNKDITIQEYNKQIEELKNKLLQLQNQVKDMSKSNNNVKLLENKFSKISLGDRKQDLKNEKHLHLDTKMATELQLKITDLEKQCEKLENEVCTKQIDISSLEEVITIRDSLCKDLQDKLNIVEAKLNETRQRLDMVNGHHTLALEANESIRKEYKAELEMLKLKYEEDKQIIISKSKADQENVKSNCNALIDSIKSQMIKEKCEELQKLQHLLTSKDNEMKAKLEQMEEATCEKLRLCEIQFEERYQSIQEHYANQQKMAQCLEKEAKDLKYNVAHLEEQNAKLQKQIIDLKVDNETLTKQKINLTKEINELKEEAKRKLIDFENEINRLMVEVDKATKEKNKFELSLAVTRDIVQVLTVRLRESDNEVEHLEGKVQSLITSKETLENELTRHKNLLDNTVVECNEYKDALVNILKSKTALAKEHTRIMEHNVTLIESLQNVEKEAYRELGTIKNELIEDVEILRQESDSQIKQLREEVEQKRMLCKLAKEHAGQATAAAEQSRILLAQAASEINRLETENQCFQRQIQDQQSLVVELSLLRQENEELAMTVAKQSSVIDKLKLDVDHLQSKPKSPSIVRKTYKSGKENLAVALSPLRERNY